MKNIRIEKIADMVNKGMIVADIGTDHALLPILLVQQGKSNKVYACDIAKGPLESAKANIEKFNLSTHITTILSDGLEHVPSDSEVVVIAGMGYLTAKSILENAQDRLSSFHQIITEINRDPQLMREWISSNNYTITDESFVYEKGHGYSIISFNTNHHESYSELDIEIGPILKEKKDEEYISFLKQQYDKFSFIISKGSKSKEIMKRKEILQSYLKEVD